MIKLLKERSLCFWVLVVGVLLWFPLWEPLILNTLGPSTEYHNPTLPTAKPGPDGKPTIYVGDEFWTNIVIVRHKKNGNCRFVIDRYFENIDGPEDGKRHRVSHAELQFIGQDELRFARWPSPPDKYIVGHAVDDNNKPLLNEPLLPEGVDAQEFAAYVVGRYYCNWLDDIIPRYIQGPDRENETPHVKFTVRRKP